MSWVLIFMFEHVWIVSMLIDTVSRIVLYSSTLGKIPDFGQ